MANTEVFLFLYYFIFSVSLGKCQDHTSREPQPPHFKLLPALSRSSSLSFDAVGTASLNNVNINHSCFFPRYEYFKLHVLESLHLHTV